MVQYEKSTAAILFTDKAGELHELKFEWDKQPSLEEVAGRIVRQHQERPQQPQIIDILRTDQARNQTQIAYFGYKFIDIKLVGDPNA